MFTIIEKLWEKRWDCYHKEHGRYLYLCKVFSESLARELIDKEKYQLYKWYPNYIILRFPEFFLFDLSNPRPPFNNLNSLKLMELWEYSREIAPEIAKNMGCILVDGENLQSSLLVCGKNISTLNTLYSQFINMLTVKHNFEPEVKKYFDGIENPTYKKHIKGYPYDFIKSIQNNYAQYFGNSTFYWSSLSKWNWRLINLPIKKWLVSMNYKVCFILHSGLPFLIDYLMFAPNNLNNVFVTELHLENDPYEFLRKKISDIWFYPKKNVRSRYLIVDKAFSGGTLIKAKQALKGNPLTVAVYPKSYSAIIKADYCFFAGKLFTNSYISKSDVQKDNWFKILTLIKNGNIKL